MKIQDLIYRRLHNQRICAEKGDDPASVVRWMGAMQAQDYTQSTWAIGLRTHSGRLVDVERAIADGQILRTWPMRGTIHFVPAGDARWMLQLSAARTLASNRARHSQLGLDSAAFERAGQLFYDALSGGRRLTRPEMMDLLDQAGISSAGQRGYHILSFHALNGLVCIGPMQGRQQTFALLDEWAPQAREMPREAALAELALRYFTSHGPATVQDFARWSGQTLGDARLGLAGARESFASETLDGQEYFWHAQSLAPPPGFSAGVQLLPGFDEYLLGYAERSAVLRAGFAQKIVPGGNGVFRPMLVIDGQIAGTWRSTVKKNALEIQVEPFDKAAVPQEPLAEAARRYSQFLSIPLVGI